MSDKKKVLIIDDDPEILNLLEIFLKEEELEAVKCENGVTGLELAKKIGPDVIILDIMLPDIDGLKLCRILKGDKETKHIPVCIITALSDKQTKLEGFESDADDFIVKPIEKKELIKKIRALLTRKEEKNK